MARRKHNSSAGFSLIEVLVAITILGLVVVPIGSSLVLSFRLNARSQDMLQAQLAVSSAVETIMAEGFDESLVDEYETEFGVIVDYDRMPETADTEDDAVYYELTVTSEMVSIATCVRPAPAEEEVTGT